MKKIIALLLCLVMVLSFAACSKNESEPESSKNETPVVDNSEPEEENESAEEPTVDSKIENSKPQTNTTSTKPQTPAKSSGLSSDFKKAMDSYEKFMDEYVAFMKKYKNNPSDLSLLSDYANFMSKYTEQMSAFEKWEDKDLTTEELDYYLKVQTRVNKKLLEVAQ